MHHQNKIVLFLVAFLAFAFAAYEEHQQEDENNGDASYNFQYSVQDEKTGDYKSHHEVRTGKEVRGVYTVKEADGRTRIVKYTVGPHTGFNAVVEHVGEATIASDHGSQHNFAAASNNQGSHETVHGLGQHSGVEEASEYGGYQELSEASKFPAPTQSWAQASVPVSKKTQHPKPQQNEYNYQQSASSPVAQSWVSPSGSSKAPKRSRGTPKPHVVKASQPQKPQAYSVSSGNKVNHGWAAQSSSKGQVSLPKANQYQTSSKHQGWSAASNQVVAPQETQKYSHVDQIAQALPAAFVQTKPTQNQGWTYVSATSEPSKVEVPVLSHHHQPTQNSQSWLLPSSTVESTNSQQGNSHGWNVNYPIVQAPSKPESNAQMALLTNLLQAAKLQPSQTWTPVHEPAEAASAQQKPVLFHPTQVQMLNTNQYAVPQALLVNSAYQPQLVQANAAQQGVNSYVSANQFGYNHQQ